MEGLGAPPLSALGRDQAGKVADRLAGGGIDAIYVTTLCRTAQTAAPLAERLGLAPVVEPGLRGVHLGGREGGPYRKRGAELHPIAQGRFAGERWEGIPGAEALGPFARRGRGAI